MPQLVVVVQILIAQAEGKDALFEQLLDREVDQVGVAKVVKTLRELPHDAAASLDFPQQ